MTGCKRMYIVICLLLVAAVSSCNNGVKNADVLLFAGTGTSANDVTAIETVLDNSHIKYATVTSAGLNAMDPSKMMGYKLLIIPGGDFIKMGNNLTAKAALNIHNAVAGGVNYIGICAGAFLAGHSAYYNCFNLTAGTTFGFYSAENKGIRKAAVAITSPGNLTTEVYWQDGPQLQGWGAVVAKYPDGTPAVAEGNYGKGFIILTGIHAEAPAEWRNGMIFNTTVKASNAYAAKLILAALHGGAVPHY